MVKELSINEIRPSKNPVRQTRDEEKIKELAQSISEKGVLQPIKVRPVPFDGTTKYEIVFGARRWEASKIAGLETIPAIIDEIEDSEAIAEGLVENIQKEDMLDIDVAKGLQRYLLVSRMLTFPKEWDNLGKKEKGNIKRDLKDMLGLKTEQTINVYLRMLSPERKPIVDEFYEADPNIKDVKTKAEWLQQAMPNEDVELQKAVARKAVEEDLGQRKVKDLARSVSNAPSQQAKEKLLEWEFNSNVHNPEFIAERAERFGAHDDLYQDEKPTHQEEWEKTPEVKLMVGGLTSTIEAFIKLIKEIRKTSKIQGKFSSETKQFIAYRLKKFRSEIDNLLSQLEEN